MIFTRLIKFNICRLSPVTLNSRLKIKSTISIAGIRSFGGYIEDAQLAMYGLELFQDINGPNKFPDPKFIIPSSSHWPEHLWGFELGKCVVLYNIGSPVFSPKTTKS